MRSLSPAAHTEVGSKLRLLVFASAFFKTGSDYLVYLIYAYTRRKDKASEEACIPNPQSILSLLHSSHTYCRVADRNEHWIQQQSTLFQVVLWT